MIAAIKRDRQAVWRAEASCFLLLFPHLTTLVLYNDPILHDVEGIRCPGMYLEYGIDRHLARSMCGIPDPYMDDGLDK